MNAKVSRKFVLSAAVHYDDCFIINSYDLNLYMDVTTEDVREQNVALERIKYIIDIGLENCVFVNSKEIKVIDAYEKAGIRVCPLPDDPFDQIVASVLLSKFNAITDEKLYVSEIKIKSRICDDVAFYVSEEDAELYSTKGSWWTDSSIDISYSTKKNNKKEKIVELRKELLDWNTVGLGWKEETSSSDKGEIVFIVPEK